MNVLSKMSDETYLSEINIAGTHDSATAYVQMENTARCQGLTIAEQLKMGVRLLDIRLSRKGEEFYLVHSLADCYSDKAKTKRLTFGEVLSECKNFLKENHGECLILSIKQDRGIMSRGFFPKFCSKYISGDESAWYLKNEVPTLGDVRGKLVLIRRCRVKAKFRKKHSCGLDFSEWKDQGDKKKTTAERVILHLEKEPIITALVQDRYCLEPDRKWQCAKHYLDAGEVSPIKIALHFLSTSVKTKGSLAPTAEYINKAFMSYDLKKKTGWILCDFPEKELIEKIMISNIEKSDVK